MKPLITVDNLCMDFEGKRVLDSISFEIGEGEVLGIIGRSGAGKTVLMHLIRGVEQPPTSGSIVYHVAACDSCEFVAVGSTAGKACPKCNGTLKELDVDFWDERNSAMKRRIMKSTAIMFQRTFALYGNDRVIENILHALDDINYPQDRSLIHSSEPTRP
jgi:methyl coenzyme M reductase system subunit A2